MHSAQPQRLWLMEGVKPETPEESSEMVTLFVHGFEKETSII